MKNNIRIISEQNIVTNAAVEIRTGVDEEGNDVWVDIREMVNAISWAPRVGDASVVTLKILPAEVAIHARLSDTTLNAFGDVLRAVGWSVEAPAEEAA